MKKYSYDRTHAKQLLPLLESIATEIRERQVVARRLEKRLEGLRDLPDQEGLLLNLKADLAEQRRELRQSRAELERLGCQEGQDHGRLFLIPGIDGTIESGFRWEMGQDTVHRNQADSSAA